MGWFWGSKDNAGNGDPLSQLDPSLRDFLKRESPIKYDTESTGSAQTTTTPEDAPAEHSYADIVFPSSSQKPGDNSTSTANAPSAEEDDKPKVPAESLYQDGRYAHIWKGYKPLTQIENEHKTEQDKLMDVVEAFKQRRAQIGIAAVENCADEHYALNDCWRNGSWKSRVDMCGTENRAFSRCYMTQARFLKALGYVSNWDRPAELEEKIQMHADKLYHRMLDQQRQVDEAKAAGNPIPQFPPLIPKKGEEALQENKTAEVVASMPDESHIYWVDRLTGYYTPALRDKKRPPPPPDMYTASTSTASTSPQSSSSTGSKTSEDQNQTPSSSTQQYGYVRESSPLWTKLFPNSSFTTPSPSSTSSSQQPSSPKTDSSSSPSSPPDRAPIPFELPPEPEPPKSKFPTWSFPTFNPFKSASSSSSSSSSSPSSSSPSSSTPTLPSASGDTSLERKPLGTIEDVDVREALSRLAPDVQAQLRRKIEKLPEFEREIELRSIATETVLGEQLVKDVADRVEERERARQERRRKGTDTFSDKVSWFFGW